MTGRERLETIVDAIAGLFKLTRGYCLVNNISVVSLPCTVLQLAVGLSSDEPNKVLKAFFQWFCRKLKFSSCKYCNADS
ncbi:hypothetical protein AB205_0123860 [Aquarana catesbeiana]|uniref:Uncharacterized protein n=1 Tax=Aquarana catesbeiana TaxID=8400 RepID=A0A2G9SF24_AQUCT|nr:hypothetical protein AB205_0123860 [Aquarana catesbeiana]